MIEHVFENGVRASLPRVANAVDDDRGAVLLDDLAPWQVRPGDLPSGELPPDEPPPDEPPPDGRSPEEVRAPWECLEGIEDVAPCGMLGLVLEEVHLGAADDRMLVETVAAWSRMAAWAELNGALAAAELSRRASMNPQWRTPAPAQQDVTADELAMRLSCSRRAAARLVRDGRCLENELLLTADAVRNGAIDGARMRVLTDRLHDRAPQLAWAIQERVLPGATTRTPRQLAEDVDRALFEVDPTDAADRLAKGIAARRVCRPRRLPDGMAGIWAVVPAGDAARADGTLDATARAARALGDPRTLDQLRADVFVGLVSGEVLATSVMRRHADDVVGPAAGGEASCPGVTTSGEKLADGGPALDGGSVDSRPPPADRRPRGTGPADSSVADDEGVPGDVLPTAPVPHDATAAPHASAMTVARHTPAETSAGRPRGASPERPPGVPPIRIPRVRIDVKVALSTLMGLDDRAAELAGYGPISAEQARALAAGGVWRRLVTDPLTGAVLDVGRARYRPPRPLAEHVLARDAVCAAPGCSVPAARCDIDHTVEFHGRPGAGTTGQVAGPTTGPGRTAADNLGPLSSRCHRLKTDGGFTLTQVEPGTFEWRTPAGLAYRVTPGDHGRAERRGIAPRPNRGYPDEPPF